MLNVISVIESRIAEEKSNAILGNKEVKIASANRIAGLKEAIELIKKHLD